MTTTFAQGFEKPFGNARMSGGHGLLRRWENASVVQNHKELHNSNKKSNPFVDLSGACCTSNFGGSSWSVWLMCHLFRKCERLSRASDSQALGRDYFSSELLSVVFVYWLPFVTLLQLSGPQDGLRRIKIMPWLFPFKKGGHALTLTFGASPSTCRERHW